MRRRERLAIYAVRQLQRVDVLVLSGKHHRKELGLAGDGQEIVELASAVYGADFGKKLLRALLVALDPKAVGHVPARLHPALEVELVACGERGGELRLRLLPASDCRKDAAQVRLCGAGVLRRNLHPAAVCGNVALQYRLALRHRAVVDEPRVVVAAYAVARNALHAVGRYHGADFLHRLRRRDQRPNAQGANRQHIHLDLFHFHRLHMLFPLVRHGESISKTRPPYNADKLGQSQLTIAHRKRGYGIIRENRRKTWK